MENCNRTKSKMSTKNAPIHIRFILLSEYYTNSATIALYPISIYLRGVQPSPVQSSPFPPIHINSFYRVYYDDL